MKFLVDNMVMGAWTWVEEILQWIGMWIDALVYKLLAAFYNIFMAIVKIDLGDVNDMFDNLLMRIYLVLGLFMLFKISFNLLQMLVNPDKVSDSSIGGPAMAKNIFISLIMLVAFPLVFNLLGDAQKAIIDNGVIEKVVLGDSAGSLSSNAAGPAFSWTLLSAFLHPADGNGWEGGNISTKVQKAYGQVWDGTDYKLTPMVSVVTDSTVSYTPIISSIVGIFMIFYLISFSFDVGSRIFKLMFLEILAPVPIISYMDPAKGKGIFERYRDEYISTYLELFIRLGIIYLALLLANKIMVLLTAGSDGMFTIGDGAIQLNGLALSLAKVILVIAIFNFAKTVPTLINNVFGFKNTKTAGKGSVGMLAGAVGLGAGAIGGAVLGGAGGLAGSLMRGDLGGTDAEGNVKPFTLGGLGKVAANTVGGAARSSYGMGKAGLGAKSLKVGALGAMGGAAAAGIRRQGVVSEATKAAGGWWNLQKGRLDNATGGEYRAKKEAARLGKQAEALKGSADYTSAKSGLETAQSAMTSAQNRVNAAQSGLSDAGNLKTAITAEFARQYGVSYAEAESYMLDNPNAVNEHLQEFATSNPQIQKAIEDYSFNHQGDGDLTNIDWSTFDFNSVESGARSEYFESVTEQRAAQAGVSSAEAAMKVQDDRVQELLDQQSAISESKAAKARKAASEFPGRK